MKRRAFIKGTASLSLLPVVKPLAGLATQSRNMKIKIDHIASDFERQPLVRPFGFKGGYLTELWQAVSLIQTAASGPKIGLATQSVLYGDPAIFSDHSESAGNALMYALSERALRLAKETPFHTPVDLLSDILPEVTRYAASVTGRGSANLNFIYNALVSVDNAAWLVYASENKCPHFDAMIPDAYKKPLGLRNPRIAVMYQIPYGMPMTDLVNAAEEGYFVFKIKTGMPGDQEQMLRSDMERLDLIHRTLKDLRTPQTKDGRLIYTLDANGRYGKKESLLKFLDHAKKIGAFEQIKLIEEPFWESNNETVGDVGVIIGADESVHTEADAIKRIQQGYKAIVLKGIAKTLSVSFKIAKVAYEHHVACMCADLTVNPLLLDWHKNLAARLQPFPGIGMPMIETNGDMNYKNWDLMKTFHPVQNASWQQVKQGVFELDDDFYERSGGIFMGTAHYEQLFHRKQE
ncbi:mandelate racemase/muconate lactonizing enzyme family protein [Niabella aurantiaca]|uniref:mandelate racemase/muconate lactonizing enzyme family protein n=1 Tax=Niabella aurantiaca TaxID=379900 RepID=UPI00036A354B|nr:mandelate racemase/muconate lactonizing enzyme family protein [Niabella aurantiaca]